MSNKFKRILSTILAVVMMVSTFVTVNVSSVFAASQKYTLDFNGYTTDSTITADSANYFTITGATAKTNSIDLAKALGGAIEFTVKNTANVTISASSTATSNVSSIALYKDSSTESLLTEATVTDATATELTANNLEAGTYRIVSPKDNTNDRGVRIYSVTVVETTQYTVTIDGNTENNVKLTNGENTVSTGSKVDENTVLTVNIDDIENKTTTVKVGDNEYINGDTFTVTSDTKVEVSYTDKVTDSGSNDNSKVETWLASDSNIPTWLNLNSASSSEWTDTNGAVFTDNIFGTTGAVKNKTYYSYSPGNSFTIETGVNATLKLYMVSTDNNTATVTITSDDGVASPETFTVENRKNTSIVATEITLSEGTYTFTVSSKTSGLFAASLTTTGEIKTTLKGSVYEKTTYGHYNWLSDSNIAGKDNVSNIATATTELLASGTITFTDANGKTHTTTVTDGKYVFDDDIAVGEGTLSIKNGDGTTLSQNVTIEADKTNRAEAITVDAKTYTVTFTTNIKDYKSPFYVKQGNTTIAKLEDQTFTTTVNDVSTIDRTASTTHILYLPKGDYTCSYSGSNFTATYNGSASGDFTVNGTTNINITLTANANVTIDTATTGTVKAGLYTFTGAYDSTVASATYEGSAGGNGNDIVVVGDAYKTTTGEYKGLSSTLTTENGTSSVDGYVVFTIAEGDSFLANISTSQQACVLYTEDGSINGSAKTASVDSNYGSYTLLLTAGTYVLRGTTDKSAQLKSINFFTNSVFKFDRYTAGKVIGKYDHSNDYLGTADVSDYDAFAFFFATDATALTFDNINNIGVTGGMKIDAYNDGNAVASTTDTYSPNVYQITGKDGNLILMDKTEKVYKSITAYDNDDEADYIQADDDTNYYYAVELEGSGTYYVVGGTYYNGKWLVEDNVSKINLSTEEAE